MQKKDVAAGVGIIVVAIFLLISQTQDMETLGIQITIGITGLIAGLYFIIHGLFVDHLPRNW